MRHKNIMSEGMPDRIEFRMLDHSNVGDDVVSFKLEDGTIVKVKVTLERAGIATNYCNPDGTPHYAVNTSVKLYIIPHDRRFTMPKGQIAGMGSDPKNSTPSHIA